MPTETERMVIALEAISITLSKIYIETQDAKTYLKLLLEHFSPPTARSNSADPSGSSRLPTRNDS